MYVSTFFFLGFQMIYPNPLTPTACVSASRKKSVCLREGTKHSLRANCVTEKTTYFCSLLCAITRARSARPLSFFLFFFKNASKQDEVNIFHTAVCMLDTIRRTDLCESSCESLNSPIARTLSHSPGRDTGRASLPYELGCGLSVCTSL